VAEQQDNPQPDKLDIFHAHKRGGPLTPEQRAKKQARFLKAFSESGNIKYSCKVAGITRQTYYDWKANDPEFAAQLEEAKFEACDTLEYAAYERAVKGVESYVVSMGRVVYEDVPALDENGKPKLDKHGEPIMRRGKPIKERKFSDTLLQTLLKANMPEKYKDKQAIEHTGKDGGPMEFVTEWGGGALGEDDDEVK
jgi:hypothetical protein